MNILKQELFSLVLRNKEIEHKEDHQEEFQYNLKCISIIVDMAGPSIVKEWRKEYKEIYL